MSHEGRGWTDPTEFLASVRSAGPLEAPDRYSEFLAYDGADLDVKFLLALKRSKHGLANLVSVPNVYLCIDRHGTGLRFSYRRRECDPFTLPQRVGSIRSGLDRKSVV